MAIARTHHQITLTGTGNGETLTGTDNADTLDGAGGNDTLIGNGGNDTLIGGPGADTMIGGTGDDIYFVDNVSDQVVEAAGEGNDRVFVSVSYALPGGSEVEVTSTDWNPGTDPINITGNEFANAIIGNEGANSLSGGGGNDTLVGNGGNDVLSGGAGVDVTVGGAGDDYHFVDSASDLVIEGSGQGNDRVFASASYALAAGSEVEVLSTDWNPGTDAINLTGNEFANMIFGNEGANSLDGGAGNDMLIGNGGNDTLIGGTGADTMIGGTGNDFYFVDNAADLVSEAASKGNDRVFASVSYTLSAGAEVETLSTDSNMGTDAINLTGNEFANTIFGNEGANILNGGAGDDVLIGNGGTDTLIGGANHDILYGGDGNDNLSGGADVDYLDGGAGTDTLNGGAGNDTYQIDDVSDVVIEAAGGGNDQVFTSVSYTLAAGAEVETLSTDWTAGTGAIDLTGNELNNTLIGNDGMNRLDAGAGHNLLIGRGGADSFVFSAAPDGNNMTGIWDFVSGTDKILLDHNAFAGLPIGQLAAGALVIGTQAGDADDRIIYDSTTGNVYYDADGNGAGAAVRFSDIQPGTVLNATDIQVI